MKHRYSVLIIFTCIMLLRCGTRNKVTYDIPANYPEERRKELIDIFEKGKKLYKIHCADCHGIFTAGKDKIPNFTNIQLDNYSARFIKRDPKNHAVVQNMSAEQLNQVLTFLRFKKRPKSDTTANAGKSPG